MAPSPRRKNARPDRRILRVPGVAQYDTGRRDRTGVPEVVLAEGKRTDDLVAIVRVLHASGRGVVVSRLSAGQARELRALSLREGLPLEFRARERVAILDGPLERLRVPGVVALVTAGTADAPIAEEAEAVLEALGVRTVQEHDVGVAGLHRLLAAVKRLERHQPWVYLAFAGREGALPTVLAGLVRAPVVGVPTSVGYGRGGNGEAALGAMLQSCAPIAVVNIDAGVPAALFAAQLIGARGKRPNRHSP